MLTLLARQIVHFLVRKRIMNGSSNLFQSTLFALRSVYTRGDLREVILRIARPKKLHLIDPWKYEVDPAYERSLYSGSIGQNQAHMDAIYDSVVVCFKSRRVEIHGGSSATCSSQLPDSYFDWIYIDGNHQYEFVKQDLELYFPKSTERRPSCRG